MSDENDIPERIFVEWKKKPVIGIAALIKKL